jgi:hypothetical protein
VEDFDMMYMVTAVRDIYDTEYGVEVAGIFDTEEKAFKAKAKVVEWMEENEYEDYEVFVSPMDVNRIEWYEVEKNI